MRYTIFFLFIFSFHIFGQFEQGSYIVAGSMATSRLATAVPATDIGMIQENPAYGGLLAVNNSLLTSLSLDQNYRFHQEFRHKIYHFFAGADFQKKFDLPIKIGISFANNYFDFGPYYRSGEGATFEYQSASNFTISAYFNLPVKLSFGLTYKFLRKKLGVLSETRFSAYDLGFLSILPIESLIPDKYKTIGNSDCRFSYELDYMIGFSIRNLGNRYYYVIPESTEILDRELNLGHSLTISTFLNLKNNTISIFSTTYGIDAHERLVHRDEGPADYKTIPGSINFIDHLISGKGNSKVQVSKGLILSLFEIVTFYSGIAVEQNIFTGNGSGFMIETTGISRIINSLHNDKLSNFFF